MDKAKISKPAETRAAGEEPSEFISELQPTPSDESLNCPVPISLERSVPLRPESRGSHHEAPITADALPQIVWITDANGRVTFFNKKWSEYTGVPYEPTTAAEVAADFVHTDDGARTMEAFEAARAGGTTFQVEHRIRSRAGDYRWFLVRADPDRDPVTGEIVRWLGTSVDIHDRRIAEDALAKAAARHEFRVKLADAIRNLRRPGDVKRTATRVLGEHLSVNRAFYAEVRADDWIVEKRFETGVQPLREGTYSAADFGTWVMDTYRAGQHLIFRDVRSDTRFSPAERTAHEAVGIIAAVGVPLIKSGELVAILTVHSASSRDWTEDDIALVDETAERTWDAVKRVRAEAELQKTLDELEVRVRQRTSELDEVNKALSAEVEERKSLEQVRVDLIRKIVTTQEEERRRMSRDLHDQLGQQLTVLRLKLSELRRQIGDEEELASHVRHLQDVAYGIDHDVSFLSSQLRPTALDDLGLESALKAYVEDWSQHFGIELDFHCDLGSGGRFSSEVETQLYRIAQEALNNVAKHAHATHVAVLLERRAERVVMVVEDDGAGFDPVSLSAPGHGKGLGLVGMLERAKLIGGDIEVESERGRGATIYVKLNVS